MAWDEYGVWKGSVTQENGEWLVGDKLPADHPGHRAADDPHKLMVKYWRASQLDQSQKYAGRGHKPALPAHGGRTELVAVLRGWFYCECDGKTYRLGGRTTETPAQRIIRLRPYNKRRWFLGDAPQATGVTICYMPSLGIHESELAHGWQLHVLDTAHSTPKQWEERLAGPSEPKRSWRYGLLAAWRGILVGSANGEETHDLISDCCDYVYTRTDSKVLWRPHRFHRTVAAVVYY